MATSGNDVEQPRSGTHGHGGDEPSEAPFKYRCDPDCRSARCPAALERIARGWRNGRDKA